jgi:hypothetical protein
VQSQCFAGVPFIREIFVIRLRQNGNDRTDADKPDSGKAAEIAVYTPNPTRVGGNGLCIGNYTLGRISSWKLGFRVGDLSIITFNNANPAESPNKVESHRRFLIS